MEEPLGSVIFPPSIDDRPRSNTGEEGVHPHGRHLQGRVSAESAGDDFQQPVSSGSCKKFILPLAGPEQKKSNLFLFFSFSFFPLPWWWWWWRACLGHAITAVQLARAVPAGPRGLARRV